MTDDVAVPEPPTVGGPGAGVAELQALLGAVLAIGADLDLSAVLTRVVKTATSLVSATYGALGVVDPTGTHLTQFITVGIDAATRSAIGDLPRGHGVLGRLIADPRPLRLTDIAEHPDSFGFPPNHPTMTSFLGVPIFVRGEVFGTLYLADKVSRGAAADPANTDTDPAVTDTDFTDADIELVTGLATAAGVAIDNARLATRAREVDLVEDRERIARDLHDTVIQRLFAAGLSLQAVTRLVDRPEAVARIERTIDDLDETVRQIRAAIFSLQESPPGDGGFRRAVQTLALDWTGALGFEPEVHFDGPVDTVVGPELAEHALAVVREGFANVARHARAAGAMVRVGVARGHLAVHIEDTGVGPAVAVSHGRGLADVIERAESLGGTATFGARVGGGSTLRWTVPLQPATG